MTLPVCTLNAAIRFTMYVATTGGEKRLSAAPRLVDQAVESALRETPRPHANDVALSTEPTRDRRERHAVGEQ